MFGNAGSSIQEILEKIQKNGKIDNKSILYIKKYIRNNRVELSRSNKESINDNLLCIINEKVLNNLYQIILENKEHISNNINDLCYTIFEFIHFFMLNVKNSENKKIYDNLNNIKGIEDFYKVISKVYAQVNSKNKFILFKIYELLVDIEFFYSKLIDYNIHFQTIITLFANFENNSQKLSKFLTLLNLLFSHVNKNDVIDKEKIESVINLILNFVSEPNNYEKTLYFDNILSTLSFLIGIIQKHDIYKNVLNQIKIISFSHQLFVINQEINASNDNINILLRYFLSKLITNDDLFLFVEIAKSRVISNLQVPNIKYDIKKELEDILHLKDNSMFNLMKIKILDLFELLMTERSVANQLQENNALKTLVLFLQSSYKDNDNYNNVILINEILFLISSYKSLGNVSMVSENLLYTLSLVSLELLQSHINNFNEKTIKNILYFLKWKYGNTRRAFESLYEQNGTKIFDLFKILLQKYGDQDFLYHFFKQIPNGAIYPLPKNGNEIINPADKGLEDTLKAISNIIVTPDKLPQEQKLLFIKHIQSLLIQIQLRQKEFHSNSENFPKLKAYQYKNSPKLFQNLLSKLISFLFKDKDDIILKDDTIVKISVSLTFSTLIRNPFKTQDLLDFSDYVIILINKCLCLKEIHVNLLELLFSHFVKLIKTKNDEIITSVFSDETLIYFIYPHLKMRDDYSLSLIKNIVYVLYIIFTMNIKEKCMIKFFKDKYFFDFLDLIISNGNKDETINKQSQTILSLIYTLYKNVFVNVFCTYTNNLLLIEFLEKLENLLKNNQLNYCVFYEISIILKSIFESDKLKLNTSKTFLFLQFYQAKFIDFLIEQINLISNNYTYENVISVADNQNYKNNNISSLFTILIVLLNFDFSEKENEKTFKITQFLYEKLFIAINNIFPSQNLCHDFNYINVSLFTQIIDFIFSITKKTNISLLYNIESFRNIIYNIKQCFYNPPDNSYFLSIVSKIARLFENFYTLTQSNEILYENGFLTISFLRNATLNYPKDNNLIKKPIGNLVDIEKEYLATKKVVKSSLELSQETIKKIKERVRKKDKSLQKDIKDIFSSIRQELEEILLCLKQSKSENINEIDIYNERLYFLIKISKQTIKENISCLLDQELIDILIGILEGTPFYFYQYVKNEIFLLFTDIMLIYQNEKNLLENKKLIKYVIYQFSRLKEGSFYETNLKFSEYLTNKYETITLMISNLVSNNKFLEENKEIFYLGNIIYIIQNSNPTDKIMIYLLSIVNQTLFFNNNSQYLSQHGDEFCNLLINDIYIHYKTNYPVMEQIVMIINKSKENNILFDKFIKLNIGIIISNILSKDTTSEFCYKILSLIKQLMLVNSFNDDFLKDNKCISSLIKKCEKYIGSERIACEAINILEQLMTKKDLKIELDKVYNYLFLLLTQTVDNSILARGLFLLENLIQNYPKVEIAKTSNLDTLVTICNQNINNVDIVKSFLNIMMSLFNISIEENKNKKVVISNVINYESERLEKIVTQLLQVYKHNLTIMKNVFDFIIILCKSSLYRYQKDKINEKWLEVVLSRSGGYFEEQQNNAISVINTKITEMVKEFLIIDENCIITSMKFIFQYVFKLISTINNKKIESSGIISLWLDFFIIASKKDLVKQSINIAELNSFFVLVFLNPKNIKDSIPQTTQILVSFYHGTKEELSVMFFKESVRFLLENDENNNKEEIIDTNITQNNNKENETEKNEDNEKTKAKVIENLSKIAGSFNISDDERELFEIAKMLMNLYQKYEDQYNSNLIEKEIDNQNMCNIFKIITKFVSQSRKLKEFLNSETLPLIDKIQEFVSEFKKFSDNELVNQSELIDKYINGKNAQNDKESDDNVENINNLKEDLAQSIRNTFIEIQSLNQNNFLDELNKKEMEKEDKNNIVVNLEYQAKTCLSYLEIKEVNDDIPKNKTQSKNKQNFEIEVKELSQEQIAFLTGQRQIYYYNNNGDKKNAIILMDPNLKTLVIFSQKHENTIFESIKVEEMDSCVRDANTPIFKKAKGIFSKPNSSRCFCILRKKTFNSPQKNINLECKTEPECINYVDFLSTVINNSKNKK